MTTTICTVLRFLSTLSLRRATMMPSMGVILISFLSTLSLRRATRLMYFWPCGLLFLSTLSLRRATREAKANEDRYKFLSTLSLRRATTSYCRVFFIRDFYPRSPCGERLNGLRHKWASFYFYPRSPCGERHNINSSVNTADKISIHALLAESD